MKISPFTVPAFAKINWKLDILGKRDDGYHELCTIFQTVTLADRLHFSDSEELILTCDQPHVPTDETNLIIKSAKALRDAAGVSKGARIRLEKAIPSPGGLGGGSADAAITLLALSYLWELDVSRDLLIGIGSRLGADVPYFLTGGTALGTGRGTEIQAIEEITEDYMLIVTPQVNVMTAEAFARTGASRLTNEAAKSRLIVCHKEAKVLNLRQSDPKNDFEKTVFEIEPEIKRVRDSLLEAGALRAMMSGSGSSVFGIFDNDISRRKAADQLVKEQGWRVFAVKTLSRDEYRQELGPCGKLISEV